MWIGFGVRAYRSENGASKKQNQVLSVRAVFWGMILGRFLDRVWGPRTAGRHTNMMGGAYLLVLYFCFNTGEWFCVFGRCFLGG